MNTTDELQSLLFLGRSTDANKLVASELCSVAFSSGTLKFFEASDNCWFPNFIFTAIMKFAKEKQFR